MYFLICLREIITSESRGKTPIISQGGDRDFLERRPGTYTQFEKAAGMYFLNLNCFRVLFIRNNSAHNTNGQEKRRATTKETDQALDENRGNTP